MHRFDILGGQEQSLLCSERNETNVAVESSVGDRSIAHFYVTTFRRSRDAIRNEIVQASENFLLVIMYECT